VVGRREYVQVVTDCVFQSRKGAVVEEGRRQGEIPERRRSKLVAVGGEAGDLFETEVFVFARSIKNHIAAADAEERSNLRYADAAHLEIADERLAPESPLL